ncbi:solute carrier family 41 member 1 [Galendromus occidentalis]|uniref:Solute carrier family 41 member 1 n=1 Tax=Galendromus occidentalis TaxID=34638 RepID=A0AAJ6QUW3_9ACAR|nr:solute carrier family 41 member 1 [Galendromus occidentalis]
MFLTLMQVLGPFLIAGLGSMGTGLLLDVVKDWHNFENIDSLITLVPTLLGLKGNLEMTVTARLCTASNLGILDDHSVLLRFLRDDLLLTQFQATIVSLLASVLTLLIQGIKDPEQITVANCIVVISSAVVTAAIACLFLGCLMTLVVYLSRKARINPDNVCAPLAASLGDISTLGIFAYTSFYLYLLKDHLYIPILLAIVFMCLCPMWGRLAWQSPEVRIHLQQGWLPILLAMCISLGAGYILDIASKNLEAAAAFVPVVSGICGNLLVILVCRMTTVLRRQVRLGEGRQLIADIRNDHPFSCRGKPSALKSSFRVLAALPFSHIIFSFTIAYLTKGVDATWVFMAVFLLFVFIHGLIMLLMTRETVLRLWQWGVDPDVASIPILTAVADLTGGAFTCIIFVVLYSLHDSSVTMAADPMTGSDALLATVGLNSTTMVY